MTACRNKARGAVVAALAGALTLGAAPVMALADGASLMAEAGDTLTNAKVVYENGEDKATFTYDGERHGLVPESITPTNGTAQGLTMKEEAAGDPSESGFYYFYVNVSQSGSFSNPSIKYVDAKDVEKAVTGQRVTGTPDEIGTYAVVIGYWSENTAAEQQAGWKNGWNWVPTADTFRITAQSLEDAVLIEGDDASDTTFAWDGTKAAQIGNYWKGQLGLALDGVALTDDDFRIEGIYATGSATPITTGFVVPGQTYTVKIAGEGNYEGDDVEKTFTVDPLDLSSANVETKVLGKTDPGDSVPSVDSGLGDIVASINGKAIDGDYRGASIAVAFGSAPEGGNIPGDFGEYTFTLSATDNDAYDANGDGVNDWVTGEKTITVVYTNKVATIDEGADNKTLLNSDGAYAVDLTADKVLYFDPSDITATWNSGSSKVDADEIDVTYADAEGNEATADDLKELGTWYVNVRVHFMSNGYPVDGVASYKVVNSYDKIGDENVFVSVDGENVEKAKTVSYTGEDYLETVKVTVAKGGLTLVEDTDYTVSVTKGGKPVDSIVDAGEYLVTVKGINFSGSKQFTITVEPAKILAADTNYSLFEKDDKVDGFLPYTGEAITPTFTFYTDAAKKEAIEVPAESYKVTYALESAPSKKVELKEVGLYVATFEDALNNDNYDLSAISGITYVNVSDTKVFVDVPNGEYYTEAVYQAAHEGYIEGMNGSNMFAPNRSISRADMVVVLYRMAGGQIYTDEGLSNAEMTYISDFEDVDKGAYYAKALAWAVNAGVVTGYDETHFGPADDVTVEQFVTMLARYADAVGNYEAVDADEVLGTVADGDQVSQFAEDAVAWAIDNGYLAQGGADIQPQSPVTRGRAITIAVRYQPEQADVIGKPATE